MTRWQLALALLVVLAGTSAGGRHHLGTREDLVEERAALAATSRQLDGMHAELAAATADVGRLRTAQWGTTASAATTSDQLLRTETHAIATATERDGLGAELTSVKAVVATAEGVTALTAMHVDRQSAAIIDLSRCLDGVDEARTGRLLGEDALVLFALRAVADPCARAEGALADPRTALPAFPYDFPDPFVLPVDGGYLAYATNGSGGHLQVMRSTDLASWSWIGEALPVLPAWATGGRTWAPAVLETQEATVMYYAARDRASGHQCLSVAVAPDPVGPFTDASTAPMFCQHDAGGSIDPSVVVDGDRAFLLWKSEGETVGGRAVLWSAPLTVSRRSLAGFPTPLVHADQPWERGTVEGPSMARVGGRFLLLYSGGRWDEGSYATGAAWCDTPVGPCTKVASGPIMASDHAVAGPGGTELFVDGAGAVRVAYHGYRQPDSGYPSRRPLHVGRLAATSDGRPAVGP